MIKISTFEACEILKVDYEAFRQWLRYGFVSISYPAKGQGTKAEITIDDLIKIALFKFLIDSGFIRSKAKEIIEEYERGN
jgi:hypothetical protein